MILKARRLWWGALCILFACMAVGPARADFAVCDLGVAEFTKLAYSGPLSERLPKWPMPPNLVVLSRSNAPDLTADVAGLQGMIGRYGFWKSVEVSYVRFASSSELASAIANVGANAAIAIVDDQIFGSPPDEVTRAALRKFMRQDELADQLLQRAQEVKPKTQLGKVAINAGTLEIQASTSLIRATPAHAKVKSLIFAAFIYAVAPNMDVVALQKLLYRGDTLELSPTGVGFFKTLMDPRVVAGAAPSFFISCPR